MLPTHYFTILKAFAWSYVATVLLLPTDGLTQESWTGQHVMLKSGISEIRSGQEVIGETKSAVLSVLQDEGDWLQIRDSGVEGWIPRSDALLLENAEVHFTHSIEQNSEDSWSYEQRAIARRYQGNFDGAIEDYGEAIRLNPEARSNYNNRADTWLSMKEYDKALADYDQATQLDPEDAYPYSGRGLVWTLQEDYEKSAAEFSEAIRLDANDPLSYGGRAYAWLQLAEFDKVIADCDEAIRLDSSISSVFHNRGSAWQHKGELDRALADFDEALQRSPENAESHSARGTVWKLKQEYARALEDFSEAIRVDPEYARPYNERAWVWATCPNPLYRDGRQAIESARRACELTNWEDYRYLDTLAAAMAEFGDFAEAARFQSQAIELTPEDEKADYQSRLTLYQLEKPYREETPSDSPASTAAQDPAGESSPIVFGNTEFAIDIYQHLRTRKGNLFFSPYSISTALAMTYGGAAGDTQEEMAQALRFPQKSDSVHAGFADLVDRMQNSRTQRAYELHIANALWAQKEYAFNPQYFQLVEDRYDAALKDIDFRSPTEAIATINRWVEGQTKQRIKDLLQPDAVDSDTKLVLTNAIYFKAAWAEAFDKQQTKDENFFAAPQDKVMVPMMHLTESMRYVDEDSFQLLEVPYANNELSMLIVLPKELGGLETVEKSLSAPALEASIQKLEKYEVELSMPKFSTTSEFKLKEALVSMGMRLPFDRDRADFSAMTNDPQGLCIGEVVHKAFVDVNEDGTEAAAATAVIMAPGAGAAPRNVKKAVVRADHPFIFLIRENETGSLLFMGRVVNP